MLAKKRTVLVVEDEDAVRQWIVDALTAEGFVTVEAADGAIGLDAARRPGTDLVLLDLLLPKLDGYSLLAQLRRTRPSLPIIIVSARGSEEDRVKGLRMGADDYVVKPFSRRELLARVEAVMRRSPARAQQGMVLSVGNTVVDASRREVAHGAGERVLLSQIELSILDQLASNAGRAVSRDELLSAVWGLGRTAAESRAIDMHITRLRQKLAGVAGAAASDWIVTVRGTGYMLGPNVQVVLAPTTPAESN